MSTLAPRLAPWPLAAGLTFVASKAGADGPCSATAQHTDETVIAYEPSSGFTICRGGHPETDVVAGHPVYVELVRRPGVDLFRFRVHGRDTQTKPTGLRTVAARIGRVHADLHEIVSSSERVAELPGAAGPLPSAVDQSRALYLGVATARFHEALASLARRLEGLSSDAESLGQWCDELTAAGDPSPLLESDLRRRCGDPRVAPATVGQEVSALAAAIDAYRVSRDAGREALIAARAKPDDAEAQRAAVRVLDDARRKALDAVDLARRLDPAADALASNALLLREVAHGRPGALQPGIPLYLARFSRGGIGSLQIDAAPVELAPRLDEEGGPEAEAESSQTFRFPVVSLHFLDLEAGVAATGGPLVPSVSPQGQIVGENVSGFVGLALVELEPARFLWPDRPLAGLLRLPVVGIPFTRDPTRNFFVGLGLGWTGVGSISGGPYLLRELALDSGFAFGDTVPKGTSLESVSSSALRVGYFASASIDLLGLVHLFFTPREPMLDATTGSEGR